MLTRSFFGMWFTAFSLPPFPPVYSLAEMASKAPKEIAKKAWTLFSQRFLIQANHTPYWDKPSEMAVRPGEPYVEPCS